MSRLASMDIAPEHRGLWGDIFCIHWALNWLKIPIRIWSKSQGKCYLHFNLNLSEDTFDILFHDENALAGYFEPFLRNGSSNLEENQVNEVHMSEDVDGESCFQTLCQLHNNEYDVFRLRRIVAQTFCNAIMQNDSFVIRCIHAYIGNDVIKKVPKIVNWQGYIIQLALPYKEGNIEGGLFVYQWLARTLIIEIHIWSFDTRKITTSIPFSTKGENVFDILDIRTNKIVYKPLKNVQMSTNKNEKLSLTNGSKKSIPLGNLKSLIRDKEIPQQTYKTINEGISSDRSMLDNSNNKRRKVEYNIPQRALTTRTNEKGKIYYYLMSSIETNATC